MTPINYIKYDALTGELILSGNTYQEDFDLWPEEDDDLILKLTPSPISVKDNYYDIETDEIKPRPDMESTCSNVNPIEDEEITITCPSNTEVSISGVVSTSFINDDESIELTFELPGAYAVVLKKFPFSEVVWNINVSENVS